MKEASLKTKLIREAGSYRKYMQKYGLSNPWILPFKQKPKRNNPCICSSGKKFKKCCINK